MRILHVLGKLDRGGVETWLVQVLRHIDREKYQMDFLVHAEEAPAGSDYQRLFDPVQDLREFLRFRPAPERPRP